MSDVEDFVQVNISRETRALSVKSFSTPLLLAAHSHYLDRVREYRQADDLLDDGFDVEDKVYLDALAVKSQNPAPETFKVGRRANPDTQVVHIIPVDVTVGLVQTVEVDGIEYPFTNPASATVALVANEIVSDVAPPGITVTDGTTHAVFTATTAGVVHRIKVSAGLKLVDMTADGGVVADLVAIEAADPDWYGLALDNYSEAVIAAAAVWVEARPKIMALQSADHGVRDGAVSTDIASDLMAAGYTRMWGTWHGVLGGSFAAANLAERLASNPGLVNPAHRTLPGQPVDSFTATQQTAVRAKRWSTYETTSGINHTFEGKTPANEYIDQVISSDWLKFRMQEAVFGVFVGNNNVPQTNAGIATVELAVSAVLKRGSSAAFPILDPNSISVFAPDISEVPQDSRLARTLPDITWSARFQGSFNRAKPINGTITV